MPGALFCELDRKLSMSIPKIPVFTQPLLNYVSYILLFDGLFNCSWTCTAVINYKVLLMY